MNFLVSVLRGLCLEDHILQGKFVTFIVKAQGGAKGEIDKHSFFEGVRGVVHHGAAGSANAENNLRKFHLAVTSNKASGFQGTPESGLEGIRGLGGETVPDLNCTPASKEVFADS
jgi:hypothetical protein